MTFDQALSAARAQGVTRAAEVALMAQFCDGPLQRLVGAVSPRLAWEGAIQEGLTTRQLAALAGTDADAVHALMWV